jgi:spore germination protein YaaH
VEYTLDGVHYQVWLEDESSLFWKLELSEKYELAGISCWKLGMEPESFWEIIREMIG